MERLYRNLFVSPIMSVRPDSGPYHCCMDNAMSLADFSSILSVLQA